MQTNIAWYLLTTGVSYSWSDYNSTQHAEVVNRLHAEVQSKGWQRQLSLCRSGTGYPFNLVVVYYP
jgi:hypothetical protein